ncbi:MAG: hypothetical protein WCP34_08465 [Pseudomonadota bacterium]
MQVERLFEQVKDRQVLIKLPDYFNDRNVEIIVLTADDSPTVHRRPHPDIAGKVKIHGDIINSVPEADWEAKKEFPEDKPATQPYLGDLAVRLFGTVAGIELNLPKHPPHEPLEFGR